MTGRVLLDPAGLPTDGGLVCVRRQIEPAPGKQRKELATTGCAGPTHTPLRELIRVAARVGDRGVFQTGRAKPAWITTGPILAGLARSHHPGHARRRLPRRTRAQEGRKGNLQPAAMG